MTLAPREENLLSLFLVAPVFLYLGWNLLVGFDGWDAASVAGFVVIPLLLAVGIIPLWGPLLELLGFLGLTGAVILAVMASPGGGAGVDFAAGVLLGSPILLGTWAWTPRRTAPGRLIGLGLALLEGIILLAALRLLQANGQVENSYGLFYNYTLANLLQVCGIAGYLNAVPNGCPQSLTFLPLRDLVDPVFVLLAGLALLGVLVPALSPRTGEGAPGHAESADEFDQSGLAGGSLPLAPEMARGLARRTPPRPAPGLAPPGTGALVVATLIVLGFVVVAVNTPTDLLLPTMLLLVTALIGILYLNRSPRTVRLARGRRSELSARMGAPVASPPEHPLGAGTIDAPALPPPMGSGGPLAPSHVTLP